MNNSQLFPTIWLLGSVSLFVPSPASAQEASPPSSQLDQIPRLNELERPSTRAADLLAQSATVVQVTKVRLNPTASGIEVILETADGATIEAKTTTEGNTIVAEVSNAVLALPNNQAFAADNPAVGITKVSVTQLQGNRLQIQATGETAPPVVAVRTSKRPVASVPVQPPDQEEVEVVVTGDRETPYRPPNSGTATGTDTEIIDTPFSIQIIPQEVLRDQQVTRLEDSLRNVSGVAIQGSNFSRTPNFSLRGFENAPTLRDGFRRYGSFQASPEIANIEQIEVLKGPASILYGEIQPGGVVNLVSKQPLSTPFYEAELQVGSRGLIRPRFDISGPLTADGSVLYRLNGLYQTAESFRDFDQEDQRFLVAPTLTWKISERTTLGLSLEYFDNNRPADGGVPVIGREVANVPRDRVANDSSDAINSQFLNVGYNLEHRFSENWKVRNAFRFSSYDYDYNLIALQFTFDEATATQGRSYASQEGQSKNYSLQTNIIGEFATGSIEHTILFGVDLNRSQERIVSLGDFLTSLPLNIFNPVYGQPPKLSEDAYPLFGGDDVTTNRLGVYIQDQISFNNFKLLAGIRYDTVDQKTIRIPGQFTSSGEATQNDDAFTPRLGLIYQPIPSLSLYASYSRSFTPNSARTSAG